MYICLCIGCTGKTENSPIAAMEVETFEGENEKLVVYLSGLAMSHSFSEALDEDGKQLEDFTLYPSKHSVGFSIVGGEFECPYGNIFAKAIEDFSKERNIPVEIHFEEEYTESLQEMYDAGKELPDVLLAGRNISYDYPRLAEQNLLLDFTEAVSVDEAIQDTEQYYDRIIQGGKIENKQYLMPILFNMNGAITSQQYLQSIGKKLPEQVSFEDVLYILEEACKAETNSATVEAIFETSSQALEGGYIPHILLAAAYPSYFDEMGNIKIEPETVTDVLELMERYHEQDLPVSIPYKHLEALDGDVYGLFGFFLSGGREGGEFTNSLLTDAAYLQSLYEENDDEMVLCGIPTAEDMDAYSANMSVSAAIFQSTIYPNASYQLIRYLMDYEFPPFYGFSINQEITEKQLNDIQETTTSIYPDVMWGAVTGGYVSVENMEHMTKEMKPLKKEYAEIIQNMLDHIAGGSYAYPDLKRFISLAHEKELQPEAATKWIMEHIEEHLQIQGELEPFYDMAYEDALWEE